MWKEVGIQIDFVVGISWSVQISRAIYYILVYCASKTKSDTEMQRLETNSVCAIVVHQAGNPSEVACSGENDVHNRFLSLWSIWNKSRGNTE